MIKWDEDNNKAPQSKVIHISSKQNNYNRKLDDNNTQKIRQINQKKTKRSIQIDQKFTQRVLL